VDGNSIGLETVEEIAQIMAVQNIDLVDATVNGGANRLADLGVLHVSGPKAPNVEAICRGLMRVNLLGERVGTASCLKLLMSGIAKGLPALFLEVNALAEAAGMSEAFLQSCYQFYPDLMKIIERTLITYPRHALRRVGEISDTEQMGRALQLRLGMIHEACEITRLTATVDWENLEPGSPVEFRAILQRAANAFAIADRSFDLVEVFDDAD
jgi:3-hydroxyisobutyrate dehydrogenase-like beta-hydroxyacid dehydrogenase